MDAVDAVLARMRADQGLARDRAVDADVDEAVAASPAALARASRRAKTISRATSSRRQIVETTPRRARAPGVARARGAPGVARATTLARIARVAAASRRASPRRRRLPSRRIRVGASATPQ